MNINPILNTIYPPAWGAGTTRSTTIGNAFFQSGTHINPDIQIPDRAEIVVSAIIRHDGSFELELKTHLWEDGLGVFYSYDTIDDIYRMLRNRCPIRFLRTIETSTASAAVREWISDVLTETRHLEEGTRQ